MNSAITPKPMLGIFKVLVYGYMILYCFVKYSIELISFKIRPDHYVIFLKRLLVALKGFYSNKIIKIDGKYKIQLYLPAFPSKPFFHAIRKFDPRIKNPGPITVVFSMTKACTYKCPHCYQRNDKGPDLDINLLKKTAKDMQEIGVSMFDLEGGEPLIKFERLLDLVSAFDDRAEIWVNTTGHTLTDEMAKRMKEAGVYGVMISLHFADEEKYDQFTGIPGSFKTALKALEIFPKHGIVTAVNFCPSADEIRNGGVEKLFDLTAKHNVSLVQVIHAKPSGAWLYEKDEIFESTELMGKLQHYHDLYNETKIAKNYPSIIFQVLEEDEQHFGCTAGGVDRFYLNHEGEVQPCEFLNVSFGNVNEESFGVIFNRMREAFPTPSTSWLCCSEAYSIGKAMKDNNVPKTPLPKEFTLELVKKWNKGKPTPLYTQLGIYKK